MMMSQTMTNIIASSNNSNNDDRNVDTNVDNTDDDDASHKVTFDIDLANPRSIDQEDINIFIGFLVVGAVVYVVIMAFAMAFRYFLMVPFEYGYLPFSGEQQLEMVANTA